MGMFDLKSVLEHNSLGIYVVIIMLRLVTTFSLLSPTERVIKNGTVYFICTSMQLLFHHYSSRQNVVWVSIPLIITINLKASLSSIHVQVNLKERRFVRFSSTSKFRKFILAQSGS